MKPGAQERPLREVQRAAGYMPAVRGAYPVPQLPNLSMRGQCL